MAEVTADESAKAAGDKKEDLGAKDAKGKGNFFAKHKMWFAGGAAVLLGIFWLMSRNSSSSSTQSAAAQQATQNAESGIDPSTGYSYGSPADIAALGGSGTVSATPGPQGPTGTTGATGATGKTGAAGNGLVKLTFAQAQKIAGKAGSSNLYYGSGGKIVQGKYANDSKVTYYTNSAAAVKAGVL